VVDNKSDYTVIGLLVDAEFFLKVHIDVKESDYLRRIELL
jgi:hypothetical protein